MGIWRVLAAPGAFDGSCRLLAPGGLGGSLLGPQTVTVKTLVENRVENGVEIYLTYVFEEYEESFVSLLFTQIFTGVLSYVFTQVFTVVLS